MGNQFLNSDVKKYYTEDPGFRPLDGESISKHIQYGGQRNNGNVSVP